MGFRVLLSCYESGIQNNATFLRTYFKTIFRYTKEQVQLTMRWNALLW